MSDPPEKLTLGYLLNKDQGQARGGRREQRRRQKSSSSSSTPSPELRGRASRDRNRRQTASSSARQSRGRLSAVGPSSGHSTSSAQPLSRAASTATPISLPQASSSRGEAGPSSSQRSFQCELCNRSFVERGNLNKHISSVHRKEKNKVCPEPGCGKSFSFRDGLVRHIAHVHQNQRSYACQLCDKTFKQASHLSKHMRSIHRDQ